MRTPRDLLTTWETWSERAVNRRALANARTDEQRDVMRRALADSADMDPLDVLRDMTELVSLLSGWRWQVMGEAKDHGASWEEIGATIDQSAEQALPEYADAVRYQMLARKVVDDRRTAEVDGSQEC
jgi:hypothetical protein